MTTITRNAVSGELAGMGLGESMRNNSPVTIEEKKKWLRRVSRARLELIDLHECRRDRLEAATNTVAGHSGAVVAGSKNPHKYDGLAEIDADIAQKEKQVIALQNETIRAIQTLSKNSHRKVLRKIYVNCMTVSEAAAALGYSESHTKALHRQAVEDIRITRKMLEKNEPSKRGMRQ